MRDWKVLGVRWWTNRDGTTGIVKTKNYSETRFYIGHVDGRDEQVDVQTICEWGSTVNPCDLINFLKGEK